MINDLYHLFKDIISIAKIYLETKKVKVKIYLRNFL